MSQPPNLGIAIGAVAALMVWGPTSLADEAKPNDMRNVRLIAKDGGFQLIRNGQPYFIKGVGGDGSRKLLVHSGGNSFRTWGADNLQQVLDEAQQLGLSVTVGFWLGHERHGFNYNDADQVAAQAEQVEKTVEKFKHHPAVLVWALGNEMEGSGDNAAIWLAVNHLAGIVKRSDANHPTMTVIAEMGGNKVKNAHRFSSRDRHLWESTVTAGEHLSRNDIAKRVGPSRIF